VSCSGLDGVALGTLRLENLGTFGNVSHLQYKEMICTIESDRNECKRIAMLFCLTVAYLPKQVSRFFCEFELCMTSMVECNDLEPIAAELVSATHAPQYLVACPALPCPALP
jgi:hypothetical protein